MQRLDSLWCPQRGTSCQEAKRISAGRLTAVGPPDPRCTAPCAPQQAPRDPRAQRPALRMVPVGDEPACPPNPHLLPRSPTGCSPHCRPQSHPGLGAQNTTQSWPRGWAWHAAVLKAHQRAFPMVSSLWYMLTAPLQHRYPRDPQQNVSEAERAWPALQVHSPSPLLPSAMASRLQGARTHPCLTPSRSPGPQGSRRSSLPAPATHPHGGEKVRPGMVQGQSWCTAFPSSFAPSSPQNTSSSASLPTPPLQPDQAALQAADTPHEAAGCHPPRDSRSSPRGEGRSGAELFT